MSAGENLNGQQFDTMYHITDNPKFAPDARVPHDNTLTINERTQPGLFLTHSPERWVNGSGYARPFVAEVKVPHGLARDERWGGEKFVPADHLDKVQVSRVMPLDAHAREEYGMHGWVEGHHGTSFDTGEKITAKPWESPFRGYHYDGPDARDMTPEQVQHHVLRTEQFQQARAREAGL